MFHEKKMKEEIKKILKNGGALIDAGAYIGDTSIMLANDFPNNSIYAIEPSGENCNFINNIIKNNNLQNLKCLNSILSNKEEFYSSIKNENKPNANYSLSSTNGGLKSTTLDLLVANGVIKEKIGILHYDVEGMELEVLQGSEQTIKTQKPAIIVEMLNKETEKNKKIIEYLKNLNYNYKIIDESCCFGDFTDSKKCRNYLFQFELSSQQTA
jgi:FkbM family methyltransferase